jgi:hypothetical protein
LSNDQLKEANGKIHQLSVRNDVLSDVTFSNSPESRSAQISQKIVIDFPKKKIKETPL